MQDGARAARTVADMAQGGLRLDPSTVAAIASAQARQTRSGRIAAWIIAIALAVLAWTALLRPW